MDDLTKVLEKYPDNLSLTMLTEILNAPVGRVSQLMHQRGFPKGTGKNAYSVPKDKFIEWVKKNAGKMISRSSFDQARFRMCWDYLFRGALIYLRRRGALPLEWETASWCRRGSSLHGWQRIRSMVTGIAIATELELRPVWLK